MLLHWLVVMLHFIMSISVPLPRKQNNLKMKGLQWQNHPFCLLHFQGILVFIGFLYLRLLKIVLAQSESIHFDGHSAGVAFPSYASFLLLPWGLETFNPNVEYVEKYWWYAGFHVKGNNGDKTATKNLTDLMVYHQDNVKCIPLWSGTSHAFTILNQFKITICLFHQFNWM